MTYNWKDVIENAKIHSTMKSQKAGNKCSIEIRLDDESKRFLSEAAKLRRISISDYVRTVTVPQARREVSAARENVIVLPPEDQLAFWNALNETPKPTPAQRRLGKMMRGKR
jgi:uncharacterized protein (DUF1778 family)